MASTKPHTATSSLYWAAFSARSAQEQHTHNVGHRAAARSYSRHKRHNVLLVDVTRDRCRLRTLPAKQL
jgi:hypothetical protein